MQIQEMGVFPKIVVPQNRSFIMENPIKMDDLGGNTPIFGNTQIDSVYNNKLPSIFCMKMAASQNHCFIKTLHVVPTPHSFQACVLCLPWSNIFGMRVSLDVR